GRSGGGGYLVKADLLVNQAFQPFCFFRNRSFEGRSKPPGKPRGYPSTQSSDSIEARNLTEPTDQSKKLFQTPAPTKPRKPSLRSPVGPARLRARRRYTAAPSGWQGAFHKKSKNLNELESPAPRLRRPRAYTRDLVCRMGSGETTKFSPPKMKSARNFITLAPRDGLTRVLSSTFLAQAVAPQH